MPLIPSCFWTYPTTAGVPAGQVLEFSVVVPPPATGAVTIPLTGSVISWILKDANGQALVPGTDYLILEGDLLAQRLAVVFKPPAQNTASKTIKVVPQLTLFSAPSVVETSSWAPQTYTLQPISAADISQVRTQLNKSLALTADRTIVEPGEPARLHVVTTDPLDLAQVVTSVLHETPHVRIRGAIPLDSIVRAFLSPVTNALGHFAPASKSTLTEAGLEVQKLLGGLFSIPLAIDVLGDKLTKTLLPTGTPQIPLLSLSPDGQSLTGSVPIGRWPAGISLAAVTWALTEGNDTTVYDDVSPGVNLLKSFLLRPKLVAMSTAPGALAPTPVTVSVTLSLALDVNPNQTIDVTPPSVTLQRVPLAVPQIAAVFKHAFDDVDSAADQRVVLTTDAATAPFLASAGDCIDLVTQLSSVLNQIVAVAASLGTAAWADVLQLAGAFGALAGRLQAIGSTPGAISFQPCLCSQSGPCVTLAGSWNNAISAIVAIGTPSSQGFVLSDSDGTGWIAFGSSYSSIIPNLNRPFSAVQQIPPNSATTNLPSINFNDVLEVLGYGQAQ